MILLIDNYDSFTYNLAQMLEQKGEVVKVSRNDRISIREIDALSPSRIIISPGPGYPSQAGISVEAVNRFGSSIPLLGVCLGHQSIAVAYGGNIVSAAKIMHGKISKIYHDGCTIFKGLDSPFEAVRYHSLAVEKNSLPDCLEITAWTDEGEIMGLRHREQNVEGVQFHPESILTKAGEKLMENFLSEGG